MSEALVLLDIYTFSHKFIGKERLRSLGTVSSI